MSLIVILVVSGIAGVLINFFIKQYTLESRQQEMIRQGERVIENILRKGNPRSRGVQWFVPLKSFIRESEKMLGAKIWTMDKEGLIYLESQPVQQLTAEELNLLFRGETITKYNWSNQADKPVLAVILPLRANNQVLGGLLIVTPMEEIYVVQSQLQRIILGSAMVAGLVAVLLAFLFSRRLTSPILAMQNLISRMRQGDFSGQVINSSDDELGDLVKHFNSLNHDLDETIELLETEKEQTKRIINSMAEGVISLNSKDEIVIINPMARRLLRSQEIELQKLTQLGEKLPQLLDQISLVKSEKKPIMREILYEEGLMLLSIISPILTINEEHLGIVIILQDISNRWRLIQLQKELVANVSHEFKTPLTSIKGFVELMLDQKITDQQVVYNSLEIIYQETLRLIQMVENLLKISRLEAQRLTKDWLDLVELIAKVVERLSFKIQEREVTVNFELKFLNKVFVDSDRFEQVFYNLIDNGIRFSPKGGHIWVSGHEFVDKIEIEIRDQGPGIPEPAQELIFDRFYKVDKSRSMSDAGSGLGLFIVKSIIEEHDGRIWVRNHPEGGAIFTIQLPK